MCSRLQIPLGGTYPAAIWTDPRQDEGGQPHSVRLRKYYSVSLILLST